MKISLTPAQSKKAIEDVLEVYRLAEKRVLMTDLRKPYKSCTACQRSQLINAFQVFRYAFREWAQRNDRGVVLRALMVADARAREVRTNGKEMVIQCADQELGEALARLLEGDGYAEESY